MTQKLLGKLALKKERAEQQRNLIQSKHFWRTMDHAPEGMYLKLFHGRMDPDQDMEDWGFDGGYIGPLQYAHMTYMSDLKLAMEGFGSSRAREYYFTLTTHDDMLVFDGAYFGDWSLFMHKPSGGGPA